MSGSENSPPPWIDLDANATTRPAPEVIEAVAEACRSHWANPSSTHRAGQRARAQVELARRALARLIDATPNEIVITASATEAIHLAIRSMAPAQSQAEILTSRIEHAAVGGAIATHGLRSRHGAVTSDGLLDLDNALARLEGSAGVATHLVNNETGAIQDLTPLIAEARKRSIPTLIDATQAVGRIPVSVHELHADYLAFSPHKFHGPKGVGVLYVRDGSRLSPIISGAQEMARRGGTEAVPAICGAGVAADLARRWLEDPTPCQTQGQLRDRLEDAILDAVPGALVNGPNSRRIWTTTNIAFEGVDAEGLLMMLSERGVGASAGAACSSGSIEPSPVLIAMGLGEDRVRGSIRLSLSRESTREQIDRASAIIIECVRTLSGSP